MAESVNVEAALGGVKVLTSAFAICLESDLVYAVLLVKDRTVED